VHPGRDPACEDVEDRSVQERQQGRNQDADGIAGKAGLTGKDEDEKADAARSSARSPKGKK